MGITKAERRQVKAANRKRPERLTEVPRAEWPGNLEDQSRRRVWVSRRYLVQEFQEGESLRLSVNRTNLQQDGQWGDKLTWEELQRIKGEVGYGDRCAVEIYPRDLDVVNVANMRQIWVLPEGLVLGWRQTSGPRKPARVAAQNRPKED